MKRMFTLNSKSRSRWMLLLLFLLAGVTDTLAQNVTIRPSNGSMICALTQGSATSQIGYRLGSFGTWKHNQLSLTMTCSNSTELTDEGHFVEHANHFTAGDKCNFIKSIPEAEAKNYISAAWGATTRANPGYITIALPKGYRFTGYKFRLSHDVTGLKSDNSYRPLTNVPFYMEETDRNFNNSIKSVTIPVASSSNVPVVQFERTSNDMGNILYFRTYATSAGYCELLFRYVELTFTADADASVDVIPSAQQTSGTSMVEVPFNTGRVDFGAIEKSTYDGKERYSYRFNSVTDMPANMLLYEQESVKSGTGFDGTSGMVAYQKNGSITTSGEYFKFTANNTKDGADRQVYYLETPVSAKASGNVENPVQFRIVGATLNYSSDVSSAKSFYITYEYKGTKYYMDRNGSFTTTPTTWSIDDDGYISTGSDYLSVSDGRAGYDTKRYANTFSLDNSGIKCTSGYYSNRYLTVNVTDYSYWGYLSLSGSFRNEGSNASVEPISSGSSEDAATLYVYDKEGENPQTISVDGSGSVELNDFNNDAIKFAVKNGDAVYMNFVLKVQALSPYINSMSVVLNDTQNNKDIHMKQVFTSDDFSVGGDEFDFYLPKECEGDDVTITFEDLYSKYGDTTYDHITNVTPGNSRYSYVKSQHYDSFTDDNIYKGIAEAKSDTKEKARISGNSMIRTKVGVVGDIAFRFNNADVLSTTSGYFTEYPFTEANYENQTNPGKGSFINAEFKKISTTSQNKTFYVFTTDETRYNIAPTTATQHRFYAFYEMKINVHLATYIPTVTFEKVYDKTLYVKNGKDMSTEAMYGATIHAVDGAGHAGYVSAEACRKAIDDAIKGNTSDDKSIPTSMDQILYLDLSSLAGVFETTALTFKDFKDDDLATNALVYLPQYASSNESNFATNTEAGFRAANDIILVDREPFFAPYDIQLDAANWAMYKRQVTVDKYGKVQNASLVLPFVLSVENGVHTNTDGSTFTVHSMQVNDALKLNNDGQDYAYFPALGAAVSETTANTPYLVKLDENSSEPNVSFIISQNGSNVINTRSMATDYTLAGTSSSGSVADGTVNGTYTFTPAGTYAGQKVPKTKNIFYFAKNEFVNSADYVAGSEIKALPFRAYYNITSKTGNAKLMRFGIIFDEGEGNEATGISNVDSNPDLMVVPGNGAITFTSTVEQNVRVNSVSGVLVENAKLQAGETRTISVPAGMYVINGVKIIVK